MHYLVDGYNLLYFFFDEVDDFSKQRDELLYLLLCYSKTTSSQITIIFDGAIHVDEITYPTYVDDVRIIFSGKVKSADEEILEIIELAKSPKSLTVITSDKILAQEAKNREAKVVNVSKFTEHLLKKIAKHKRETSSQQELDSEKEIARLEKIFLSRLDTTQE